MAIFFKFNSWNEKNFDSIPLDSSAAFMSVGELKQNIIKKKKLDKNTGLVLSNAQTGEEFKEDIEYVPKNTSIIVKVVPTYTQPAAPTPATTMPKIPPRPTPLVSTSTTTYVLTRSSTNKHRAPTATRFSRPDEDDFGPALWETPSHAIPDPVPQSQPPATRTTGYNEQDKILSIVNSAADYSVASGMGPTGSVNRVLQLAPTGGSAPPSMSMPMPMSMGSSSMKPGVAIQKKIPPPGYVCYRCGNAGHYIYDCPTNGDPAFNFQRKPQTQHGVPKTFLNATGIRPNENEFEKLIHQTGLAKDQFRQLSANIPKELICPICNKMMTNAVMLPCCGESACDDCVRGTLIDSSNFQCPLCKQALIPDELVPNKALRRAVEAWNQSGGHTGTTPPISPTFPPATIASQETTPPMQVPVHSPPFQASAPSAPSGQTPENKEALGPSELRVSGTDSSTPGTAATSNTASTNVTGADDKKKTEKLPDEMAAYYPGMAYPYPMMYVDSWYRSNTPFRMMNYVPGMPMSKDQFLAEQEKMRRMAEEYYRDPRYMAEYYGYEMPYEYREGYRGENRRERDRERRRSRSRDRSRRSRSRDRHRRSRSRDRDRKRSRSRDRDRKRSSSRDREDRKKRRENEDKKDSKSESKSESKSSDSKSTDTKSSTSETKTATEAPSTATPMETTPTTNVPAPATTAPVMEQPKSESSSSASKDDKDKKERDKENDKDKKDREKEKDKDRDRDHDKDRERKRHKDDDRKHSSSHRSSKDKKEKDRDRERDKKDKKDRDRDREKEKDREREKEKDRDREKRREKDKEREKEKDKEREKERDKRKEKDEKDKKTSSSSTSTSSTSSSSKN